MSSPSPDVDAVVPESLRAPRPAPSATTGRGHSERTGLLFGVGAYLMWGALPLYFPLLGNAAPLEIIAHRVVWSLLFCAVVLVATRSIGSFRQVWRRPRLVALLTIAAVLIAVNWTVYVVGVMSGHVLDAALGYFINPLFTILLGVVVLRERLRPAQWAALTIGTVAVAVIAAGMGRVPWIALTLTVSFGLYGLVKKRAGQDVAAVPGLAVETAVLTPFALGFLVWLGATGFGTFGSSPWHSAALASAGVVTALPLIFFSAAARRLPLSVVGTLQYLGPLLQFLCGVLVFGEAMSPARWVGFGLVWVALTILTVDGMHAVRLARLGR